MKSAVERWWIFFYKNNYFFILLSGAFCGPDFTK